MTSTFAIQMHEDATDLTTSPAVCVVPAATALGATVHTRDGHRLGTVKDVTTDCIYINARFAFDYWLSSRAIAAVDVGCIRLGIDKRQVAAYLVDRDCLEDFALLPPVTAVPVVLSTAA